MNKVGMGLAAATLAGLAGTCAQAASAGAKEAAAASRVDLGLAAPAPVPGTFDFQLAQLDAAKAAARREGPVAAPAPAAPPAFDPARPDVAMARRVVDAAWAFDSYTRKAAALDGAFEDGAGVSRAVAVSAGYEPTQLQEGAIAWGALAVLQDAGFVDAVRQAAPDAAARDALAADLLARPAAVLRLPGAREAAARVSELVGRRGAGLIDAGATVRTASYGVQKSAWAKTSLDKPADRLAAVKTLGTRRSEGSASDTAELMTAMTALRPAALQSRAAPQDWRPTPAVARSVALAALALVGRAGEDRAGELAPLLTTAQGEDCLKMAKLNLHQCLAVAGPRYEDMFCLGRHAVADTGQCLVSTAGWTIPPKPVASPARLVLAAAPVAAPSAAPASTAVAVPIALAALDGPERAASLAPPSPPVEPATAATAEPVPVLAEAAAPPAEVAPPRPRWSRPALDADEADAAPVRYARRAPAPDPDAVEDDAPSARAPRADDRRAYADDRDGRRADDRASDRPDDRSYGSYDRRASDARDEGYDEDEPPPPRPNPYRWGPAYAPYPAYGYAYGYGPGGR